MTSYGRSRCRFLLLRLSNLGRCILCRGWPVSDITLRFTCSSSSGPRAVCMYGTYRLHVVRRRISLYTGNQDQLQSQTTNASQLLTRRAAGYQEAGTANMSDFDSVGSEVHISRCEVTPDDKQIYHFGQSFPILFHFLFSTYP